MTEFVTSVKLMSKSKLRNGDRSKVRAMIYFVLWGVIFGTAKGKSSGINFILFCLIRKLPHYVVFSIRLIPLL